MQKILREFEKIDNLKECLTELFNEIHLPAEQIIHDIDESINSARFEGWQNTAEGTRKVKSALRMVMWLKYGIRNDEVFDRAYKYIEQNY